MYSGKRVEVLNTDAEGRLVLADAIARAAEDRPDVLIETSTLTGAQLVALGTRTAGVMGTEELRAPWSPPATAVGEGSGRCRCRDELRHGLDSPVADIANSAADRAGGMLVGGLFLREFVPDGLPWAHIDIAGPATTPAPPWGYTPKGGTGVPVRTLLATLEPSSPTDRLDRLRRGSAPAASGWEGLPHLASRGAGAVLLLAGAPVAHALGVAGHLGVVDRDRELAWTGGGRPRGRRCAGGSTRRRRRPARSWSR